MKLKPVPFCNIVRQLSLAKGFCDGNEDKEAEVGKHQAENEATDADPNRGTIVVLGLLIASQVVLNLLITCCTMWLVQQCSAN